LKICNPGILLHYNFYKLNSIRLFLSLYSEFHVIRQQNIEHSSLHEETELLRLETWACERQIIHAFLPLLSLFTRNFFVWLHVYTAPTACFSIDQVMSKSCLFSFNFQIYLESSVSFEYFLWSRISKKTQPGAGCIKTWLKLTILSGNVIQ
jgi:hypothetical protein